MSKIYGIGDVYYEKHTVVGISHRNGEVSETQIEVVKDVIPVSVIDEIKAEIEKIRSDNYMDYLIRHVCNKILKIIDEKVKENKE